MQNRSQEPAAPPAEADKPANLSAEADKTAAPPAEVRQEPADEPSIPLAREAPPEPEKAPAPRGVPPTVVSPVARIDRVRARAKVLAVVGMVAALAVALSWQLSATRGAPGGPQVAVGASPPLMSRPLGPAAFGEAVTLNGWQVKIAGLKNIPQLMDGPGAGLTTTTQPRAVRMSLTLVNVSDHPLATGSWTFSATVNGRPVHVIIYPSNGYVGVPNQLIQPGASAVLTLAVPMPADGADLTIEAVEAQAALSVSFTGKA